MDGLPARRDEPTTVLQSADALFDDLYRTHYRHIYGYCARRVQADRIEDVVAEVFTVAWRRIDTVPRSSDGLLWLYGVARRVVAHEWRSMGRRRRLQQRAIGTRDPDSAGPELQVVERAEYRMIRHAASQLRRQEREVLLLTAWEDLSHAEVSQVLGISEGAAKQRLHRARRRLARLYARLDPAEGDQPSAKTHDQEGGGR